jgi:hypothetical protein
MAPKLGARTLFGEQTSFQGPHILEGFGSFRVELVSTLQEVSQDTNSVRGLPLHHKSSTQLTEFCEVFVYEFFWQKSLLSSICL